MKPWTCSAVLHKLVMVVHSSTRTFLLSRKPRLHEALSQKKNFFFKVENNREGNPASTSAQTYISSSLPGTHTPHLKTAISSTRQGTICIPLRWLSLRPTWATQAIQSQPRLCIYSEAIWERWKTNETSDWGRAGHLTSHVTSFWTYSG